MIESPDPTYSAYLDIKRQNALASYLTRGRQHAQTPVEELKGRWVALMHRWLDEWRNDRWDFDHRERDDIEAELELRGVEPPGDFVRDVISSLKELTNKRVDEMKNIDPETRDRLDKEAREDFVRVFQTGNKKN